MSALVSLWKDSFGICKKCGGWTQVLSPCCNANVIYDGAEISPATIQSQIVREKKEHRKEKDRSDFRNYKLGRLK